MTIKQKIKHKNYEEQIITNCIICYYCLLVRSNVERAQQTHF